VVVTAADQPSNSITAQKQSFSPAFFIGGNTAYAAAQHADYSLVSAAHPAQPGETIMIYGTGFGPTNPAVPTGQLVTTAEPLANSVQFSIGGVTAASSFAGLVEAGVYQFNVTVPAALPDGDAGLLAAISSVQTQSGSSFPCSNECKRWAGNPGVCICFIRSYPLLSAVTRGQLAFFSPCYVT